MLTYDLMCVNIFNKVKLDIIEMRILGLEEVFLDFVISYKKIQYLFFYLYIR